MPKDFNPTIITIEKTNNILAGMFVSFDDSGVYYWTGGILSILELKKYSLGNALIHKVFEICEQRNLDFFNFLWGAEEYKIHFKGKPHCGVGIYATNNLFLFIKNYSKKKILKRINLFIDYAFRKLFPIHSKRRLILRNAIVKLKNNVYRNK